MSQVELTSNLRWVVGDSPKPCPMPYEAIRSMLDIALGSPPQGPESNAEAGGLAEQRPVPAAIAKPAQPPAEFGRRIEGELPFLRRAARQWHRDAADADDLVQDTVLRALACAHQWRPGSNLRGWLFTIMRNRFFANAARSKRSLSAIDAIAASQNISAMGRPEARLVIRDLERALRRLPRQQSTAVQLVGIDGRSYEEAARLMDMSVAAVRCHLARGRERLRTLIDGGAGSTSPRRPLAPWMPSAAHSPWRGQTRSTKAAEQVLS